jgi:hypothetical protein
MKAIEINGEIKVYNMLPKEWPGINNFRNPSKEEVYRLGFRDYIPPVLGLEQEWGNKYKDIEKDIFTCEVVDKSVEELANIELHKVKQRREQLLKDGVLVDNVWFNENFLSNFIAAITVITNAGGTEIEWKDTDDTWIKLTLQEANILAVKSMSAIQEIYKNN